ncbi:MAG: hypothetical protein E7474_00870 [Ruminococcaceae bacterium]|nr:hypothetical protein [Oscillospiraceae bacterium]
MQSRTSFFNATVFWSDQRRWWPLTAGYTLFWLLMMPLAMLTSLNHASSHLSAWNIQLDSLNTFAISGYWTAFLTSVFFAMAAFSYLANPRATNGLHALSARRETLFFTHWLAGLCSQVVPQLVTVLLTALVLAGRGAFDARIAGLMLLGLALPTVFFYSLGVLCMIFTGQVLAAPVFYGVLNILVVGVEMLIRAFAGNFLYGWALGTSPELLVFSPIVKLVEADVGSDYVRVPNAAQYAAEEGGRIFLNGLGWLAFYAAVGLVLAALAMLAYRKRHSEATGSIIAIGWARPVFRYGVAFCAALALGQLLYYLFFGQYRDNGRYSLVGMLLCMAAAGLIGYFGAEMLLKKSFRVWRSGRNGAAAVAAVLVALGLVLSFDLTGYEKRIPNVDRIESASISLNIYNNDARCSIVVTDADTLRLVTEAHRALVSDKARQQSLDRSYYNSHDQNDAFVRGSFEVTYRLKSGATIRRNYSPIGIYANELNDPASPAAALTALYNAPDVALCRTLDSYSYKYADIDPRKLPGLRFTGGYVSVPHTGENEWGLYNEYNLSPDEAQRLFDALVRDAELFHVSDSLFGDESEYLGEVELYATYSAESGGNSTLSFHATLTAEKSETLGALRAIGIS